MRPTPLPFAGISLQALLVCLHSLHAALGQDNSPKAPASNDSSWQVRDATQQEHEQQLIAKLSPADRDRLDAAEQEMEASLASFSAGKYQAALQQYRAAVAAYNKVLPAASSQGVKHLIQLADLFQMNDDFISASQTLAEAKKQSAAVFPGDHPFTLSILNRQGALAYSLGQFEQAEAQLTRAVDMSRQLFGPADLAHLSCRSDLASLWSAQGRHEKARPALLDVAHAIEQRYGRNHLQYAVTLNNLAGVDQALGDFPNAIQRLQRSLEIRQQLLGPDHEDTLTSLNNLAGMYLESGQKTEARRLFVQIVATLGSKNPESTDYATALSNLSQAHQELNELTEAERFSRQSLQIRERLLGPDHPDVATSLNNLASLLDARYQFGESEPLFRRALAIRATKLGPFHPEHAAILSNLAVHFRQANLWHDSADWYRQALDAQQKIIEATLPALPERQQLSLLSNLRRTLDGYLSVTSRADIAPQDVYRHVLWWKGQALVRQLNRRATTTVGEATAQLQAELRSISGQLAAITFTTSTDQDSVLRAGRIQSLLEQRERLEAKLAEATRSETAKLQASPTDVASLLPPGVVLIDFLEYQRSAQDGVSPRAEFTAFVLRRDATIVRIELGPVASLAESIDTWLRTHGGLGKGHAAGITLRDQLWQPLLPHLGQARTVIYSPDGCLTRLPFAALPGKKPTSFLVEEFAFAVVPVPQRLPQPLTTDLAFAPPQSPSLLLVGDIEYGQPASSPSDQSTSRQLTFTKLAAARSEVLAVRDSFENAFPNSPPPSTLRGFSATEAAFRREASTHRFIHLVTHGFVAQATPAPTIFSENLCGLALSGANARTDATADDGLLTAAEISSLDLRNTQLVTLSACETGLGTIAAGEGVLGLQRAFQIAGAQTVISSLWKVDDRATQQLMEHFYERLWSTGQQTSRLEALRQAQLAILQGNQERGVGIVKKTPNEQRVSPYYWAPFVLSGDWR
jgi:CHAT domain-containing protein